MERLLMLIFAPFAAFLMVAGTALLAVSAQVGHKCFQCQNTREVRALDMNNVEIWVKCPRCRKP